MSFLKGLLNKVAGNRSPEMHPVYTSDNNFEKVTFFMDAFVEKAGLALQAYQHNTNPEHRKELAQSYIISAQAAMLGVFDMFKADCGEATLQNRASLEVFYKNTHDSVSDFIKENIEQGVFDQENGQDLLNKNNNFYSYIYYRGFPVVAENPVVRQENLTLAQIIAHDGKMVRDVEARAGEKQGSSDPAKNPNPYVIHSRVARDIVFAVHKDVENGCLGNNDAVQAMQIYEKNSAYFEDMISKNAGTQDTPLLAQAACLKNLQGIALQGVFKGQDYNSALGVLHALDGEKPFKDKAIIALSQASGKQEHIIKADIAALSAAQPSGLQY